MAQSERDHDLAVLAFLKGLDSADAGGERGTQAMPQHSDDHVDAFLRAMGYNRIERERLRRGQPHPRNEEKHRVTTVKRFEYYIAERLPDRPAEEVSELARAWVGLTSYDLNLAQHWWTAGIDPGIPDQLANAITEGLRVKDLEKVIKGRTIAEHLQSGNSLAWCLLALDWRHRQRSA